MHDPIKIVDLARKMIHLMGYDVRDENSYRGDIAIEYSGLRPGEKLFEELLIGESVTGTEHPKIMRAEEDYLPWEVLEPMLKELQTACSDMDLGSIRRILMQAVDGFEPDTLADDPLWLEQPVASQQQAILARTAPANVTPIHKR
jgi:FlaA1/EpsC-like NDP-sugar epimerase